MVKRHTHKENRMRWHLTFISILLLGIAALAHAETCTFSTLTIEGNRTLQCKTCCVQGRNCMTHCW